MTELDQPTYTIDSKTLRETVISYTDAEHYINHLSALGPVGDAERVSWLRMTGRLNEAEALGWQMLVERDGADEERNIQEPLPIGAATSALRLAHVLHWKENWDVAQQLFDVALNATKMYATTDKKVALILEAFTWQHLGKLRFDQGSLDEARDCFTKALRIRTNLGRPADEVRSSRQALKAVSAQISERK